MPLEQALALTRKAVAPWKSLDGETDEYRLPGLDEVNICLYCTFPDCACDRCDGKGNVRERRKTGRKKKVVDLEAMRKLIALGAKTVDICKAFGISEATFRKLKKEL